MRFSILIFIACLLVSCLPPTTGQPPMGDRYLGTFEAVAEDYREVVRIYESNGLRFEHTFYRNGVLVIKESGKAEVDGYSIFFRDAFTEFIDSESARPLPQPVKLLNYSLLMLREGEPELDRLLPFAEHRYNLAKIAEQDAALKEQE